MIDSAVGWDGGTRSGLRYNETNGLDGRTDDRVKGSSEPAIVSVGKGCVYVIVIVMLYSVPCRHPNERNADKTDRTK